MSDRIGNHKLDDILKFTRSIPRTEVHYTGNYHVAHYTPHNGGTVPDLHISGRLDLNTYLGWMKKIYMDDKGLPNLPSKSQMERLLEENIWS